MTEKRLPNIAYDASCRVFIKNVMLSVYRENAFLKEFVSDKVAKASMWRVDFDLFVLQLPFVFDLIFLEHRLLCSTMILFLLSQIIGLSSSITQDVLFHLVSGADISKISATSMLSLVIWCQSVLVIICRNILRVLIHVVVRHSKWLLLWIFEPRKILTLSWLRWT